MTKPIRIACAVATALSLAGGAHAQGTGNDRCVERINNDARKVVDARAKADRRCVRLNAGASAAACVDGNDAKTETKKAHLAGTFSSHCAASLPSFGLAAGGAAAVSNAAQGLSNDVAHDLLGAAVDVPPGDAARCAEKVLQRAGQLAVTRWREFRSCKRSRLAGSADASALAAACLGGPNGPQPDGKAKIVKAAGKLTAAVQSRCIAEGVSPVGAALAGRCASAADGELANCLRQRVACRFCQAVKAADGLPDASLDCDAFDNGAVDGSCTEDPTPTPTATRTPTVTVTPTITPTPTTPPTPTIPAICQAQVSLPPIAKSPFTILPGSPSCGGSGLNPPAAPPFSGSVQDGSGNTIANLGAGCLHAGAFDGIRLPSGSTAVLDVVGVQLLPPKVTLGGSDGSGPSDCTKGAGPGRHCLNPVPGLDGSGSCFSDADCGGGGGTCNLDANCYFGPPIPVVVGGAINICIVNTFLTDMCGEVSLSPLSANLATALSARVYLTSAQAAACPLCVDSVCTHGKNAGEPCTPVGSENTSVDCPPDDAAFLTTLTVPIESLTTGTSSMSNASGIFCPGQTIAGGLGLAAARTISETGTPPGGGSELLAMTLGATFCIPRSGSLLVDFPAQLPGPGVVSAPGQLDLSQVLPLGLFSP
jgi:hypothetical protein